ncbi:MAG: NUDIX hydrolase [Candidatus Thorarchaeota archaeon]
MSDRRYPSSPIIGVGAIVVGQEGVLLGRRDKDPGKGVLSIPGGAVEIGETQEQAVKREVLEETGVECEVLRFVSTADLITLDSNGKVEYHFVLNHYLCRASSFYLVPEHEDAEVIWAHPDAIETLGLHPRIKSLLDSVAEDVLLLMRS